MAGLGKNEFKIMTYFRYKTKLSWWISTSDIIKKLNMTGSQFRGSAKRLMNKGYLRNYKQGNKLQWGITQQGMKWKQPKRKVIKKEIIRKPIQKIEEPTPSEDYYDDEDEDYDEGSLLDRVHNKYGDAIFEGISEDEDIPLLERVHNKYGDAIFEGI